MADSRDRTILRQALRGTAFLVAIAAAVCAVALVIALLFVVVMT